MLLKDQDKIIYKNYKQMKKIFLLTALLVILDTTYSQENVQNYHQAPITNFMKQGVGYNIASHNSTGSLHALVGSLPKINKETSAKGSLSEGFEGSFPPNNWSLGGDANWDKSDETTAYEGSYFARFETFYISNGETGYLITPALNPTPGDAIFSFFFNYYLKTGVWGNDAELYIDVYDANTSTWTLGSSNIIDGNHGGGWNYEAIYLGNYEGQDFTNKKIKVRFRAISDYGSYNIAIDQVSGPAIWESLYDAGIPSINMPFDGGSTGNKMVNITLKNFGVSDLTSATIQWEVDGMLQTTKYWTAAIGEELATGETTNVDLGTYNFSTQKTYNIKAWVMDPNGEDDEDASNDTLDVYVLLKNAIIPPYTEDFENSGSIPQGWQNDANDNGEWAFKTYFLYGADDDHTTGYGYMAGVDDNYIYDQTDEVILISPPINITSAGLNYPIVDFWYQNIDPDDQASHISKLYVEGWNGNSWDELLFIDESIDAWTKQSIKIDNYTSMPDFMIRFKVIPSTYSSSDPCLDDFSVYEGVGYDLGVEEILPHAVISGETIQPTVNIHNYSFFDVDDYTIVLNDGTTDISTVNITTPLARDADTLIKMDPWTPTDGSYTLTATVTINSATDGNSSNNAFSQDCEVQAFNYTAGKIIGFGFYNDYNEMILNVDVNDGSLVPRHLQDFKEYPSAGDYHDGEIYFVEYKTNNYYILNGNGECYKLGNIKGLGDDNIIGLTYDASSKGTMYVATYNLANSNLYTVDEGLNAHYIGTITSNDVLLGIACNDAGDMYGIGVNDTLYSINKTTGEGAVVGYLGLDIKYVQDIAFDRGNNILYGTLYNGSYGGLYNIELNSGQANLVGTFADQVTMCAIYPSETLIAGSSGEWSTVFGGATSELTNVVIPNGIELSIPSTKASEKCNSLTIEPGGMLTVEGELVVRNDLFMQSDPTGTASLINKGAFSVNNHTTVQQYLPENNQAYNWHYMVTPVSYATMNIFPGQDLGSGLTYAYEWDEPSDAWVGITDSTAQLEHLKGYAIPLGSEHTVEFTGSALVNGTQSTPGLGYTEGGEYEGFHLVGNPYVAAYDANNLSGSNWTEDIWIRDDGNFRTFNVATGTGTITDDVIPAMQGFWFRNSGPGMLSGLNFDPVNLVHSPQNTIYKKYNNEFHLKFCKEQMEDELVINFFGQATSSFENYDTEKMFAVSPHYPQIYSLVDDHQLAINSVSPSSKEYIIPLGIKAHYKGTYTFKAVQADEFNDYEYVYLIDKSENIALNIKEKSYSVEIQGAIQDEDRFELLFTNSVTSIEENTHDEMDIYSFRNTIYINSMVNREAQIIISDLSGRIVYKKNTKLNDGINTIHFNHSKGLYIVKIIENSNIHTGKVVLE